MDTGSGTHIWPSGGWDVQNLADLVLETQSM